MSAFLNTTITISHVIEFLEKCFAHSKSTDFENYTELVELNTELQEITMDMPEIDLEIQNITFEFKDISIAALAA